MTETALLRAVARNPDEDTPRLAFADWLDEQGDQPRAEFIRGQIEYAATHADSPRRREVAFRGRTLLDAHEDKWLEPFGYFDRDLFWNRGFVETIETDVRDLDGDEERLFDTHPFRRLWLRHLGGRADGLELVPRDNRLTALDLTANDLTTTALKKLAKFTHFPHLRELGLLVNNLRDTAVNVLCGADFFQRLAVIRLAGNPFTAAARDRLRAHFGDRVTFDYDRDPDRLYAIQDDYLLAGWGNDHTQIQLLAGTEVQRLAVFDHAGTVLRTEARPVPGNEVGSYSEKDARREVARDEWFAELGYTSATIKVKRFAHTDGSGLTPFNWWAEACDRPNDAERREHVDRVRRWLDDGAYRFNYVGDDAWFDRSGEVTDT